MRFKKIWEETLKEQMKESGMEMERNSQKHLEDVGRLKHDQELHFKAKTVLLRPDLTSSVLFHI